MFSHSKMINQVIIMLLFRSVYCTIDVNMPEMKYLASHLEPEECRKLVAALHFTAYNKPNFLDAAESKVSEDLSCLRLLLHWNSSKGEGLGKTHEELFRRLQQIDRPDLTEWLGKTVFHELSKELEKSLDQPLSEFIIETTETASTTERPLKPVKEEHEWLPIDLICWGIIIFLCTITIIILVQMIYKYCHRRAKLLKKKRKNLMQEKQPIISSDAESEDNVFHDIKTEKTGI